LKIFVEKSRHWRSLDFVIELRESTILDMLERDACPNLERAALSSRYWDRETLDMLSLVIQRHFLITFLSLSYRRYTSTINSLSHRPTSMN
jgi:hypothetical protein